MKSSATRLLDISPRNKATFTCTAGVAQHTFRGTYRYIIQWYKEGKQLYAHNISEVRGYVVHEDMAVEFTSPGKHTITCVVTIDVLPSQDYIGSSNSTSVHVQGNELLIQGYYNYLASLTAYYTLCLFEGASKPYQPWNVIVYNISHNHAIVQWMTPQVKYTSERYIVHLGRTIDVSEASLASNTTSLDLSSLEDNTEYYYRVEAINSVGSTQSRTKHFKTTSRKFVLSLK